MCGPPPYHNLTLYTWGTPNGHKAAITLEELGVQYKTEAIDIAKNVQKENWFLDLNPNGRIPALKDGDMSIFESGAIMLYLTEHYDKDHKISYPHGGREYYEMVSWLMWQMGGLGPMLGQAEHFRAMAGAYSAYSINRYVNEAKRLFGVLESRLNTHTWLAGEKYTIADIASYAWLRSAFLLLDIDVRQWPALDEWMKRIGERPAVQKGVNVPLRSRTAEEAAQQFKSMRDKVDAMKNSEKHDS